MKIHIILPPYSNKPVGGYKVVYQYANYLVNQRHEVTISYAYGIYKHKKDNIIVNCLKRLKRIIHFNKRISWYPLDKRIKEQLMQSFAENNFINADALIVTTYETVMLAKNLPASKGKKINFIQGFESWSVGEEAIKESYKLDFTNIVISKELESLVSSCSDNVNLVTNGIDVSIFNKDNNYKKTPHSICFMYSDNTMKGSKYGIEAILKLKEKYPDLYLYAFGKDKFPLEDAPWFEYTYCANEEQLHRIYNLSEVYLCSSLTEGFGLTGLESMACGCALVSSKTKGVYEYGIDEENALLVDIEDTKGLVNAVSRLFDDNELMKRISMNGYNTAINNFDIEKSKEKFMNIIETK